MGVERLGGDGLGDRRRAHAPGRRRTPAVEHSIAHVGVRNGHRADGRGGPDDRRGRDPHRHAGHRDRNQRSCGVGRDEFRDRRDRLVQRGDQTERRRRARLLRVPRCRSSPHSGGRGLRCARCARARERRANAHPRSLDHLRRTHDHRDRGPRRERRGRGRRG